MAFFLLKLSASCLVFNFCSSGSISFSFAKMSSIHLVCCSLLSSSFLLPSLPSSLPPFLPLFLFLPPSLSCYCYLLACLFYFSHLIRNKVKLQSGYFLSILQWTLVAPEQNIVRIEDIKEINICIASGNLGLNEQSCSEQQFIPKNENLSCT